MEIGFVGFLCIFDDDIQVLLFVFMTLLNIGYCGPPVRICVTLIIPVKFMEVVL